MRAGLRAELELPVCEVSRPVEEHPPPHLHRPPDSHGHRRSNQAHSQDSCQQELGLLGLLQDHLQPLPAHRARHLTRAGVAFLRPGPPQQHRASRQCRFQNRLLRLLPRHS